MKSLHKKQELRCSLICDTNWIWYPQNHRLPYDALCYTHWYLFPSDYFVKVIPSCWSAPRRATQLAQKNNRRLVATKQYHLRIQCSERRLTLSINLKLYMISLFCFVPISASGEPILRLFSSFLVTCTRLHNPPCPSVGPSVHPSRFTFFSNL